MPHHVQGFFNRIAPRYDMTNGILSMQLHRLWNRALIQTLEKAHVHSLVDLCAGTGQISLGWLHRAKSPKTATLIDFSPEMLNEAQKRQASFLSAGHTLAFHCADVALYDYPHAHFDAASIAYGVRNIAELDRCLEKVRYAIKPDGILAIVELTMPSNPWLRRLHRLYLQALLPSIGGMLTGDKAAYRYLAESIQTFLPPEKLAKKIQKAGFPSVKITPLSGGIATLIVAK